MLKRTINYLKNKNWIATKIRDFLAMTNKQFTVHRQQFTQSSAFTLAETLIVMGIIGVVAALTLPNLNSSTGDKETVAKVKKIYQNLEDAVGRAEAVYGPVSEWYKSPNGQYQIGLAAGRLIEFMKISKDCGTDITSCFPDKLQGPSVYWFYNSPDLTRTIVLADGTAVLMTYESQPGSYLRFYVDINGKKGANIPGIDAFQFNLTNFGVIPSGHDNTKNPVPHKVPYFDCTDWVINIGNMDYLKMDSSKKCNNNPSIILDGVSNITCK